jgi:hypothetical protein
VSELVQQQPNSMHVVVTADCVTAVVQVGHLEQLACAVPGRHTPVCCCGLCLYHPPGF